MLKESSDTNFILKEERKGAVSGDVSKVEIR